MRASGIALLLAAALLAGCGSSAKPAAKSNGEATKPATQVAADVKHALASARSMHMAGNIVSGGQHIALDLSIATGKGATGSMSVSGLSLDLVDIGKVVYIRGSDAFYKHFAGTAAAQLLHGKWLKGSTKSGKLASLASITNPATLLAQAATKGKLVNKGLTTYKGQQVVAIYDQSQKGTLYIAATGTPYPVALVGGGKNSGTITFDRWNQPVSLSAPKGAIDISKFGG